MIVIYLLCNGFQTFMDMAWISVGYGLDIEGVVTPYLHVYLLHIPDTQITLIYG